MKPYRKFKPFQIRWKEPLGRPECPYLYRWTFIFFGFSIRLHHWIRSDDKRYFHDHSCDLISLILKGWYYNVVPKSQREIKIENGLRGLEYSVNDFNTEECVKIKAKAWKPWFFRATEKHYLEIPKGGAWTLLLCGRPYRKWGFWVNGKKWRPLRYFHKFGHPKCDVQ